MIVRIYIRKHDSKIARYHRDLGITPDVAQSTRELSDYYLIHNFLPDNESDKMECFALNSAISMDADRDSVTIYYKVNMAINIMIFRFEDYPGMEVEVI